MKNSKKSLVMTFLMLACQVHAVGTRCDGNWWQGNSAAVKSAFIAGFVNGRGEEAELWDATLIGLGPKNYDSTYVKFVAKIEASTASARERGGDITIGQLSEGLDTFYTDYKNRLIFLPHAIRLVMRGIAGTSAEEIEKAIVEMRKQDAANSNK